MLGAVLAFAILPGMALAGENERVVEGIGVSAISGPSNLAAWEYVYFGTYDGQPVRYRVLASDEVYGNTVGSSLLLDSDKAIKKMAFKADGSTDQWAESDARTWLNGEFLNSSFTDVENHAILASKKDVEANIDLGEGYLGTDAAVDDKVFLLGVQELVERYGYLGNNDNDNAITFNKESVGDDGKWLLRSSVKDPDYPNDKTALGWQNSWGGGVGLVQPNADDWAVAPALNVGTDSVVYTTKVKGSDAIEHSLTLLDRNMAVEVTGEVVKKGSVVSVPYKATGDITQASVAVVRTHGPSSDLLLYAKLGNAAEGTASFELPADYDATTDKVLLLAERITSDEKQTDYASQPVEIEPKDATYGLSVTADPAEGGTVDPASGAYTAGTAVALKAIAKSGYTFLNWEVASGDATIADVKAASTTLTMGEADATVVAHFEKESTTVAKASRPSTEAHAAKGTIDVSWKAVSGAKTYQLQWRAAGGKWTTKTVKGRKYTITGLKRGTLYQVRVRGASGSVKGAWSKASCRWLQSASSVRAATGKKSGTLKVSWAKDAKANAGFRVYAYAKKGGKVVKTVDVAKGKTFATIKGLKAGKAYYVRVRPYRKASGTTYAGAIGGYRTAKAAK